MCDKVTTVIGILSKSRRYLPSITLKTIYNSLFLPYISYCNLIWASTYASYFKPSIYSKRKPYELSPFLLHEHVLSLFSRSFIFSLHSLYKFHVSCFVFSHCYRLLPTPLSKALQNEEFVSMNLSIG